MTDASGVATGASEPPGNVAENRPRTSPKSIPEYRGLPILERRLEGHSNSPAGSRATMAVTGAAEEAPGPSRARYLSR